MMSLFAQFNFIIDKAKRGFITISEAMREMENAIDRCEIEYNKKLDQGINPKEMIDKVFYINRQKAYHRMFKLLYDIAKGS